MTDTTDNGTNIPVPVTSNGWSPIERFDYTAEYAGGPFLVFLPDGRWNEAWISSAGGEVFDGEWRRVEIEGDPEETAKINAMEPVAFKLVEGPDMDDLRAIVKHHGFAKAA
jgi:hypothetical protein